MSVLLQTSLGDMVFDLHTDLCPKVRALDCVGALDRCFCVAIFAAVPVSADSGERFLLPSPRAPLLSLTGSARAGEPQFHQAVQAKVLQQLPVPLGGEGLHRAVGRPHEHG